MLNWSINTGKDIVYQGIKVIILLILGWYLYSQLFLNNDLQELISAFSSSFSIKSLYLLLFTVGLMIANWAIEAKRWQLLINADHLFSFIDSIKGILAGLSLAVITPARTGEYAGRLLKVKRERRLKVGLLAILAIYSQILVTIITGLVAIFLFIVFSEYFSSRWQIISLGCVTALLIIFLIWGYFKYYKINGLLQRLKKKLNIKLKLKIIKHQLSLRLLRKLLWLSFLRYFIFTVQYLLLLSMFGIHVPLFEGMMMIGCIFFIQSFLPTPVLAELGIRSGVAVYFFGNLTTNIFGIISSAMAIWLINLIIPAIIGAFIISGIRTKKTATV